MWFFQQERHGRHERINSTSYDEEENNERRANNNHDSFNENPIVDNEHVNSSSSVEIEHGHASEASEQEQNNSNNSAVNNARTSTPPTTTTDMESGNENNNVNNNRSSPSSTSPMLVSMEHNQELINLTTTQAIHRRRFSTCALFLSLSLLYLYVQALVNSDLGLFWICLVFTTWLMRWITAQREEEELLDGRMEDLWQEVHGRDGGGYDDEDDDEEESVEGGESLDVQNDDDNLDEEMSAMERLRRHRRRIRRRNRNTPHTRSRRRGRRNRNAAGGDVNNPEELDYRMLSFQTQLAMAIMESQRHIMINGGYGRPDANEEGREGQGVSDEAKNHWREFTYTAEDEDDAKADNKPRKDEDLSCCICLADYEAEDKLCRLGCGHLYHSQCIHSWCEHSIRCPLCNTDLEEDGGAASASARNGGGCNSGDTTTATSANNGNNERVASNDGSS